MDDYWLRLLRQRSEGYPMFRARDLTPEASHPRSLIAKWRSTGHVVSVAPGYHVVAREIRRPTTTGRALPTLDEAAFMMASTRFGGGVIALCGVSAMRLLGADDGDSSVAMVAVPMQTRRVRTHSPRGVVEFKQRGENIVGTRNYWYGGEPPEPGPAQIRVTAVTSAVGTLLVTSPAQTLLDLHSRRDYSGVNGPSLGQLRFLNVRSTPDALERIAFDQRRRRALTRHRRDLPYGHPWFM